MEIKPCPFCGSKAIITSRGGYDYGSELYTVSCINTECHAQIEVYSGVNDKISGTDAINKWNRRK